MLKLFHCPAGSNAPSRSSFWLQLAACLGNEFPVLLAIASVSVSSAGYE